MRAIADSARNTVIGISSLGTNTSVSDSASFGCFSLNSNTVGSNNSVGYIYAITNYVYPIQRCFVYPFMQLGGD